MDQMVLLGERLPATPSPSCQAVFGQALCLLEAEVSNQGSELRVDLTWQALQALPPDLTVSISLSDAGGGALAQAGSDLLDDWVPLDQWLPPNGARHEGRWVEPPTTANSYQVWVSVIDKTTGKGLPVNCRPTAVCSADRLQVYARGN